MSKQLLDQFFDLESKVHEYFGYVEDWVKIPLEDSREYYWYLDQFNEVHMAESKDNLQTIIDNNGDYNIEGVESSDYYTSPVYTQRFLPKWVYETDEFTMISVDTQTDGNKFLSIFDNAKRLTPKDTL